MTVSGVLMSSHSLKEMRDSKAAGHLERSPLILGEGGVVTLKKKGYDVAKMRMIPLCAQQDRKAEGCQEMSGRKTETGTGLERSDRCIENPE